jgi:hypothetical protein
VVSGALPDAGRLAALNAEAAATDGTMNGSHAGRLARILLLRESALLDGQATLMAKGMRAPNLGAVIAFADA